MTHEIYKSATYRVHTPSGTMFINIMENANGDPFQIDVHIGKAGSELAAWAAATSGLISLALRNHTPLQTVISELADITSDGTARIGATSNCRSGPEGIYSALVLYRNDKLEEEYGSSAPDERVDIRDSATAR